MGLILNAFLCVTIYFYFYGGIGRVWTGAVPILASFLLETLNRLTLFPMKGFWKILPFWKPIWLNGLTDCFCWKLIFPWEVGMSFWPGFAWKVLYFLIGRIGDCWNCCCGISGSYLGSGFFYSKKLSFPSCPSCSSLLVLSPSSSSLPSIYFSSSSNGSSHSGFYFSSSSSG